MELYAIETNNGVIIADRKELSEQYFSTSRLYCYLFDGKYPEPTFNKRWLKVDAVPTKCVKVIPERQFTKGYALKPEFPETEATPRFATSVSDGYRALYEAVRETVPEQYEDQEFSVTVLAKIEDFDMMKGLSYTVTDPNIFNKTGKREITEKSLEQQLLDKILFPEVLLAARPCKLSSYDSYCIIRDYIKSHIDSRYAELTSDYDFCLTVQKRIKLTKSLEYMVNQGTEKRPRMVTRYQNHRGVKVYEIAPRRHDGVYKGYPECQGFEGANYRELEENIKKYCEEIIAEINRPLVDCPHCNGQGVIPAQD